MSGATEETTSSDTDRATGSTDKMDYKEKESDKLKSPIYRHVTKKTTGAKKYYYTVMPDKKDTVTITMKSGSTYTGHVNHNNERHGYGVYQVVNGGRYEGYWKNGFKDGEGVFYHRSGNVQYEGEWQAGEPHGMGKVYNAKGELKYEGEFKNGKSALARVNWMDYRGR